MSSPTLRTALLFAVGFVQGRLLYVSFKAHLLHPNEPTYVSMCALSVASAVTLVALVAASRRF